MTMQLVSICMPTYNGEEFLQEALDSCLIQDYPNLELIISDDGSTDRTLAIINESIPKFKFPVKVFHHKAKGIGANWNNCILNASGEYIKFLFQDDLLQPNCITELVNLIQSGPNYALAACKRHILVENKSTDAQNWVRKFADLQVGLKPNIQDNYILSKNSFNYSFFYKGPRNKIGEPSAVLLNKKLVCVTGKFRKDLKQALDYEYWWRLMNKYSIIISSKKLATFRLHGNQTTARNNQQDISDYRKIRWVILSKYLFKMSSKDAIKVLLKEFPFFIAIYRMFRNA